MRLGHSADRCHLEKRMKSNRGMPGDGPNDGTGNGPSDDRRSIVALSGGAPSDATSAGSRSGLDTDSDSDSQAGWSSVSITKWDLPTVPDRRADKIRSWRRRALLKRGALLHVTMAAKAQSSSLAMLDEKGMV